MILRIVGFFSSSSGRKIHIIPSYPNRSTKDSQGRYFLVTSVCDCVGVRGSNEASSFGMACLLIFAGVRSVAGLPKIVPTI